MEIGSKVIWRKGWKHRLLQLSVFLCWKKKFALNMDIPRDENWRKNWGLGLGERPLVYFVSREFQSSKVLTFYYYYYYYYFKWNKLEINSILILKFEYCINFDFDFDLMLMVSFDNFYSVCNIIINFGINLKTNFFIQFKFELKTIIQDYYS